MATEFKQSQAIQISETSMKVAKRIEALFGRPANKPELSALGRSAKQDRFGRAEAARLSNAIAGFTPAEQKRFLKELHDRSRAVQARVTLSGEAAGILNRLAKNLGLELVFHARGTLEP